LIIVFGHVDIRSAEYALLFKTLRSVQWDTPIQFFGGHTHIRVRTFEVQRPSVRCIFINQSTWD
jgi:hypothetical protein